MGQVCLYWSSLFMALSCVLRRVFLIQEK